MMVFFRDAPRELEEAAYLDGYTPFRAFFKVTLPLVFPGMISVAMLCWIFAWNEYLFANLLTGTTFKTFPVHIPSFTLGSARSHRLAGGGRGRRRAHPRPQSQHPARPSAQARRPPGVLARRGIRRRPPHGVAGVSASP
jgi:hypothetical protein